MNSHFSREQEALYLIISRSEVAETKLRTWLKSSHHNRASVEGNRLKIFDEHTWHRFRVTWPHSFNELSVYDAWNRRHLYLV